MPTVLYIDVNCQCDKLVTDDYHQMCSPSDAKMAESIEMLFGGSLI